MTLSPHQQKVYDALLPTEQDIDIKDVFMRVYLALFPTSLINKYTVREMQQKLAPTFAAINKKLSKERIEPGKLKQTYRISSIKKA